MSNVLFSLSVKRKRDLLRVRQLAGQAAGLLGFDPTDQKCLAAAIFDLACQAHAVGGRARVSLEISETCFHVVCTPVAKKRRAGVPPTPDFQLSKCLPTVAPVAREDVPWMLQQLQDLTPLDVFEEIKKINQELLGVLLESARQRDARPSTNESNAAWACWLVRLPAHRARGYNHNMNRIRFPGAPHAVTLKRKDNSYENNRTRQRHIPWSVAWVEGGPGTPFKRYPRPRSRAQISWAEGPHEWTASQAIRHAEYRGRSYTRSPLQPMMYVVDSSVGLKWVLPEIDSDKALQLLAEFANAVYQLLAPDIFPTEIAIPTFFSFLRNIVDSRFSHSING
jgi:hypothetical protein